MSDRFEDDEEGSLKRLFDATAAEPERDQLDRLARFAAQVPTQRAPLYKRWLVGVPALALAIAGATVFALWIGRADPLALDLALPTGAPSYGASPEEDDPLALEPIGEDDDFLLDDPLAALDDNGGESPLALLDLLTVPDDEAALDSWSDAYAIQP